MLQHNFNERHQACDWELECLGDWRRSFLNLICRVAIYWRKALWKTSGWNGSLTVTEVIFMAITWVRAHNENKTHNLTSLAAADNNELLLQAFHQRAGHFRVPVNLTNVATVFSETTFGWNPPDIVGHARETLINFGCLSLSSASQNKNEATCASFFVGSDWFSWSRRIPLLGFGSSLGCSGAARSTLNRATRCVECRADILEETIEKIEISKST